MTSSEVLAGPLPGARVVKAGNTLSVGLCAADPREGSGKRVLFISGNDADGKQQVAKFLNSACWAVVDLAASTTAGACRGSPAARSRS
jgi:predicted dinucleotide-binding enzyme